MHNSVHARGCEQVSACVRACDSVEGDRDGHVKVLLMNTVPHITTHFFSVLMLSRHPIPSDIVVVPNGMLTVSLDKAPFTMGCFTVNTNSGYHPVQESLNMGMTHSKSPCQASDYQANTTDRDLCILYP